MNPNPYARGAEVQALFAPQPDPCPPDLADRVLTAIAEASGVLTVDGSPVPTGGRTWTPDSRNAEGWRTIHVKRCCNGCGRELGDPWPEELDAACNGWPLPDVTAECGCQGVPRG